MSDTALRTRSLCSSDPGYPRTLSSRLGAWAPTTVRLLGDADLLARSPVGWLASSQLPVDLIIPTLELSSRIPTDATPVISGFHSPVERDCLDLFMARGQPVLVCLARGIDNIRLPREWRSAVEEGRMLLMSCHEAKIRRPTARTAEARNRMVAALADSVFVAGVAPGGRLYALAREIASRGQRLSCFDHPYNHDLLLLGAEAVRPV